ncbi:glycosyltransferase family 4 protein [Methylotuvimicrobium sp. KM2]|uniref:glycosyltransferase family 4 protein n=1 Tax=Methylotuvimicrobium sp. KM2 TaxID=3133976 RepID=UPI003101A39F
MKIIHLNHSDSQGGAARAAYRIHQALRSIGIDSVMWVNRSQTRNNSVYLSQSRWHGTFIRLRLALSKQLTKSLITGNPILHSPALFPSKWPELINATDANFVNLHWINFEMLSIEDVSRINKPIVWTLHDMWAFCGAEHYTEDVRFQEGYSRGNRPTHESGFDLNRWTWSRKLRAWKRPLHIIAPSQWIADCVKQSVLMHDWPVSVIPNALNTNIWRPIERNIALDLLGLPEVGPVLIFGAIGGGSDFRKGADLLFDALRHLRGEIPGLQLLVFGENRPKETPDVGFPIHYLGHLHDDLILRIVYSAADALVVPSRQDNLPTTAIEANACGTPVVCFDTCGLPDIVNHQKNGWLAKAFDTEDLANGIRWVLKDTDRRKTLSTQARSDAVKRFSYPVIAKAYQAVYEQVLNKSAKI